MFSCSGGHLSRGRFVKIGADNLMNTPLIKAQHETRLWLGSRRRRSRRPAPLPRGERPRRVGFGAKPQQVGMPYGVAKLRKCNTYDKMIFSKGWFRYGNEEAKNNGNVRTRKI